MSKPTLNFNGYDLETSVPGLRIIASDPYRPPPRTLTTNKIARSDISVNNAADFGPKKINFTCEIGQNSRELLDLSMDKLVSILQAKNAPLLSNWGYGTRKWTATLDNIAPSDVNGGHCTVDLEFEAANGYGYDTSAITLVTGAQTGNTRTDTVFFYGTADKQSPIITITLTHVTPGTNHGITITNPATAQAITINKNTGWTDNDVIIINTDPGNYAVTLNGIPIAFTGPIPQWDKGPGTIQYADTFTSRTFSYLITQIPRNL